MPVSGKKICNSYNRRHYCLHCRSGCINSNIVQVCVVKLYRNCMENDGITCFYKELHVAIATTDTRYANDVGGVWDRNLNINPVLPVPKCFPWCRSVRKSVRHFVTSADMRGQFSTGDEVSYRHFRTTWQSTANSLLSLDVADCIRRTSTRVGEPTHGSAIVRLPLWGHEHGTVCQSNCETPNQHFFCDGTSRYGVPENLMTG